MGTWGTGPFDNDAAADWAGDLDEAGPSERSALLRTTLASALGDAVDDGADEIVAAAAVVAARLPGGPPLDLAYAPSAETLHAVRVDADLCDLALRALQRVTAEGSDWHATWSEADALPDALAAIAPIEAALQLAR